MHYVHARNRVAQMMAIIKVRHLCRSMARFDFSTIKTKQTISPNIGAIPYMEIDEGSLQLSANRYSGNAVIFENGIQYPVQFIYWGSFNTNDMSRSKITGWNLASPEYGAGYASGLNMSGRDFLQSPDAAAAAMLAASDEIIGTALDDIIDSYTGDDVVYAGSGNDRIADGLGWNTFYGQGGLDTFVVRPGAGPSWYDKRKMPANGFPLDVRKKKVNGQKRAFVLVDTSYDRFADFNVNEDAVTYEGISRENVVFDVVPGTPGIFFTTADGGNVLAYLPTVSEQQYMDFGIYEV